MSYKNIKGITVEIGGDTTNLGKALDSINKKSNSLQGELREVNRLLKFDPSNTELLTQKQKILSDILSNTKNKLDMLKEAEKQVQEQFKRGEVSEEAVRSLGREIESARIKFDKTEKEAQETATAIYNVGKASNESADDVKELNEQAAQSEDCFNKADIALGSFIGNLASDAVQKGINKIKEIGSETINTGKDFTSTMSEVRAIFNATDSEIELLTRTARKYGADTSFSAKESAEALKYMGMAGWDVNQSIDALPAVLDLAIASNEELSTTSDIVTDALTAYNLQAKDSKRFTDVLAAASSNANTNVSMMGETFKYVAPVAGAMGYNIEDSAVAIGLMANAGIKGTRSGTQLRAILSSMANPSEKTAKAMEKLGISLTDTDGRMKSLDEIVLDLRNGFSNLDEAQSAEIASCLAGKEAMSGLLAIVNASDKDYEKLKKSIYNCNGAAEKMASTMKNNLSGDLKELNSAWEEFKLKLYDNAEEPLRDLVKFTTDEVLPLLTRGGSWVKNNIPTITALLGGLTAGYISYKTAVVATDVAHRGIKNAIETTTIAQKALNLVQSASPWGLLAAAIGTVVTAVAAYSLMADDASKSTSSLTAAEQELINKSAEAADNFREQVGTTDEAVNNIDAQTSHLSSLIDELDKYVDKNGEVNDADKDRVNFILNEYANATGEEIEMVDGIIKNYDNLRDKIREVIDAKTANSMIEARNADYVSAIEKEAEAWDALTLTQEEYEEASAAATKSRVEQAAAELEMQEAIKSGLTAEIEERNSILAEKQKQHSEDMKRFKEAESAYYESQNNYKLYKDTIVKYEEAMSQVQKGNYKSAIDMMRSKESAVSKYTETVEDSQKKVLKTLQKEATDAKIYADMVKYNFEHGVAGYTKKMVIEAESGYKKALSAYKNAKNDAENVGKDLGKGLAEGIKKTMSDVSKAAVASVNQAILAAKQAADIHSPSRKTQQLGEYLGEGLEVGISSKTKDLNAAARNQMETVLSTYRERNSAIYNDYSIIEKSVRQTNVTNNIEYSNIAPILTQILNAVNDGKSLYIDGDKFVGSTVRKYNKALGRISFQEAR